MSALCIFVFLGVSLEPPERVVIPEYCRHECALMSTPNAVVTKYPFECQYDHEGRLEYVSEGYETVCGVTYRNGEAEFLILRHEDGSYSDHSLVIED